MRLFCVWRGKESLKYCETKRHKTCVACYFVIPLSYQQRNSKQLKSLIL